MKTIYIIIFCCFALTNYSYSQEESLSASEKKQVKQQKEEAKRQKEKYITEFMATIEVGDFEKEIIIQAMNSYFDELVKVNKLRLKHYERESYIDKLDKRHFEDVNNIVSEEVMSQIMDAVKGKWKKKTDKKKKKKKKRKKDN